MSKTYQGPRRLSVRLPARYESEPDKKFPIVYLLDGGPEQDFPHIAGIQQSLDLNWTTEPFILVGVESVDRYFELTPPADDPRYDALFEKRGGADQFRSFLEDEVIPWVEDHYRSNGERVVMGESLAGLFVVETLLARPTLFDKYAAISPSLWWDDLAIAKGAASHLASFPTGERMLYLTIANEGWKMQQGMDLFLSTLDAHSPEGLAWVFYDRASEEHHGSIYHVAAMDALRYFFPVAERTGAPSDAFYLFSDGQAPALSPEAQENVKQACTVDTAIPTDLATIRQDPAQWRGICVLVKLGPKPTLSSGNSSK